MRSPSSRKSQDAVTSAADPTMKPSIGSTMPARAAASIAPNRHHGDFKPAEFRRYRERFAQLAGTRHRARLLEPACAGSVIRSHYRPMHFNERNAGETVRDQRGRGRVADPHLPKPIVAALFCQHLDDFGAAPHCRLALPPALSWPLPRGCACPHRPWHRSASGRVCAKIVRHPRIDDR